MVWAADVSAVSAIAIVILTGLAVLAHNITVPVFVLAFAASALLWMTGRGSVRMVVKSGLAAAVSAAIYVFYLRGLVGGWTSTGNPTPVLISLAAHAGTTTLIFAAFGCLIALLVADRHSAFLWWTVLFIGSLGLLQFSSLTWNPRYFLFFLPAIWVLAALTTTHIADRFENSYVASAWFVAVALLMTPGLASHYVDGSRHDYREAARVIMENDLAASPILSDDAETISYYLPENMRMNLYVRTKAREFPESEFYLVARSNAWMPLPQIPNRRMQLLAEIYRRRFDQFSHILRVYRVTARELH